MTDSSNRLTKLQVQVSAGHPELLRGLEAWLQLGLISETEVLQLCRTYLVCQVLEVAEATIAVEPRLDSSDFVAPDFAASNTQSAQPLKRKATPLAPRLPGLLQAFVAEVSVLWLLFLGVFLVVVSSGVLAASQWRNFSAVGQYGILLAYTLAFWGATVWTGRNPTLRLTHRMLRAATLLIVPVNFWMMDGLRLWQSFLGCLIGGLAALALIAVLVSLLRSPEVASEISSPEIKQLAIANGLALSALHWGWSLTGIPLLATYLGTIGTALIFVRQVRYQSKRRAAQVVEATEGNASLAASPIPLPLETAVFTGMALLLIARAILAAEVPLHQLGLALGICGWLLGWLAQQVQGVWGWAGVVLLGLGWLVSVGDRPPLQAIAISGLSGWLLFNRLERRAQRRDVTALFLVGLQATWLLWFVIPQALRQSLLQTIAQVSLDRGLPWAIAGVLVFPYLWCCLVIASRLQRRDQAALAHYTRLLTLALGIGLALVSLAHPLLRSLNLLLSTLTLVWVVRRPSQTAPAMVYLTHLTGVAAAIAWIRFLLPTLPDLNWAWLFLLAMTVEWGFCLRTGFPRWRQSTWHVGLGFAAISYWLLLGTVNAGNGGLAWLLVPALLTLVAYRPHFAEPLLATWLSIASTLLVLFLNLTLGASWILILSMVVGVMLFNTQRLVALRQVWEATSAAGLVLGFCLGLELALADQIFEPLTPNILINLLAIAPAVLWTVWYWCRRREAPLRNVYRIATDAWAVLLSGSTLVILSFWIVGLSAQPEPSPQSLVPPTLLLAVAITLRLWQRPNDVGFWGLGWSVELLLALATQSLGATTLNLAIATLGVALLAQLGGDWWVRSSGQPYRSSWHSIPLIYAALGLVLAHSDFTATTGLYTLAAALTGVGVGRRHLHLRVFSYLGLAAISIAAYELLIYQLLQAEGGSPGDGIALLAGLAAVLALLYRLGDRWLLPYLNLNRLGVWAVAHLHWAIGNAFLAIALAGSLSHKGDFLWLGICALLAVYALLLGNQRWSGEGNNLEAGGEPERISQASTPKNRRLNASASFALWTYAGILEALVLLSYSLYRFVPDFNGVLGWAGAIASFLALFMDRLPWQHWGWQLQPWQRSAAILPMAITVATALVTRLQSLLITSAFYATLAGSRRQIRLSYLSLALLDWAIVRFLNQQGWLDTLWISMLFGGSLLYIAQVDPDLQTTNAKQQRHWMRCLATGLICLAAFYQAEVATSSPELLALNLLALALSLAFVAAGLLLRIRAFLYIGTIAFVIRALRQLWLFLNTYSLLLWAIGILLGLLLIWVAATFEARRSQVNALAQNWLTDLQTWQ